MLTEAQLQGRTRALFASEAHIALGLDPNRDIRDLYEAKANGTALYDERGDDWPQRRGHALEPAILDRFLADTGLREIEREPEVMHESGLLGAHPDLVVEEDGLLIPVDAKSIRGADWWLWGTPGTDEIPDVYVVQATVQAMCLGAPHGYMTAAIGDYAPAHYRVPVNTELADLLLQRAAWLMECVENRTPPPARLVRHVLADFPTHLEGKTVEATEEIRDRLRLYDEGRAIEKHGRKQKEAQKDAIAAFFGDAEAITVEGRVRATYRAGKSGKRTLDVKDWTEA